MELLNYDSNMFLNYSDNVFYTNIDIVKDKDNKFIKGKAKDLIKYLKYNLPNLYLSYANDNLTIEEVEHIQEEYFNVIQDLESVEADKVVKVCENEAMCYLYVNQESDLMCPMCEQHHIDYRNYKGTHVYVCEDCPFVGFELVDIKDKMNMIDWLSGESE